MDILLEYLLLPEMSLLVTEVFLWILWHWSFTFEVIIDLTAEKPLTRIICYHLRIDKGRWKQTDGVSVVAFVCQDLAMEECWVDVHLISHPK